MRQTAFITGAAKRMGREMAVHLAESGWNVALHYNSSEKDALLFRDELRQRFQEQKFAVFQCDLSKPAELEKLLPEVISHMQKVDLLINNASVFEASDIQNTSADFFDYQMNVNFRAPFILTRDFARLAKQGIIVNFCDTRIVTNQSNFAAYTLSKKALWEFTRMAANELGPKIRVNAIAPGLSLPPEEKNEDYLWKLAERIPMKRPGGMAPILKSLDYILDNDYLTGQLLFCDGGENIV